jgi:hypothetical protein
MNGKRYGEGIARIITRRCANPECRKEFSTNRNLQKFCNEDCGYHYRRQRYSQSEYENVDRTTIGAIQEYRVACDLMGRGYEVFKACSPSASCDLIAMKDSKLIRIQVRASDLKSDGSLTMPTAPKDVGRQDHYAFCFRDQILYDPALPGEQL